MTRFILKRIGLALITLWILSVIVFFAAQVLPGDPGRSILGPLAAPQAVAALDHQLGLDKPLLSSTGTGSATSSRATPAIPTSTRRRSDRS